MCAPYCEPGPVLPRSYAGSSRLYAVPAPAHRASICVRGVPATSPGKQEWQKKMREACLALAPSPALLPSLAVEYEHESRTLLPHHPDSKGCASDQRPVLPGALPKWPHRYTLLHDLDSRHPLPGVPPTTGERSLPPDQPADPQSCASPGSLGCCRSACRASNSNRQPRRHAPGQSQAAEPETATRAWWRLKWAFQACHSDVLRLSHMWQNRSLAPTCAAALSGERRLQGNLAAVL